MLAKKPPGHISMNVPYFESVLHVKICSKFRGGHLTIKVLVLGCCALDFMHANLFQMFCTPMPKLGQMQVL